LPTFGVELITQSPERQTRGFILSNRRLFSFFLGGRILNKSHKNFPMCKDTTNKTISKENPIKKGEESLKKKAKTKIIAHNFSRKLAEKRPIFAVHKDNLPNDTGELQKISCQGELTEFRHPWQLYSFPTVLIRSSGFLLRLVCLVYLYTSPYPCHKGSKTKHRQKYYQFHNTVILIS
jgi:hypothetical protein